MDLLSFHYIIYKYNKEEGPKDRALGYTSIYLFPWRTIVFNAYTMVSVSKLPEIPMDYNLNKNPYTYNQLNNWLFHTVFYTCDIINLTTDSSTQWFTLVI